MSGGKKRTAHFSTGKLNVHEFEKILLNSFHSDTHKSPEAKLIQRLSSSKQKKSP